MPKPMHELIAESRGPQFITRNLVGVAAGDAGTDRRECLALRTQHAIVSGSEVWRRLSQADRAGQVGRISADSGSHVDDDRLAFPDRPDTRIMMRARAM